MTSFGTKPIVRTCTWEVFGGIWFIRTTYTDSLFYRNSLAEPIVYTRRAMGANGFDRAGSTFGCEPWILVGHVKNGKKSSCE